MVTARHIDTDCVGLDDASYWGAVLAQAARAELRSVGCNLAWRPRCTPELKTRKEKGGIPLEKIEARLAKEKAHG
ncbi:MAG: hypothetical protein ACP5I8_15715 [Phycisphaerae bacterium]